jgi:hypothetical protein
MTPTGVGRKTEFVLTGRAVPVLKCEPPEIVFDANDVRSGAVKEVALSGVLPLNWDKFQFFSESQEFKIVSQRRDGDRVVAGVRCLLSDGADTGSARFFAHVPIIAPASSLHGQDAVVELPVTARREVDLGIMPKTVLVAPSSTGSTSRLLIHGKRVQSREPLIRAIRCGQSIVDWQMSEPTAAGVAIVVLTFPEVPSLGRPASLRIEFEGREPIDVPISWPAESVGGKVK